MKIPFFKMHAQGNDYVYINQTELSLSDNELHDLSIEISKKNFGIGSDGLVTYEKSEIADTKMRIFNSDGSEAEMCGSALRSLVYYLCKQNELKTITVETKAGLRHGNIILNDEVEVNMGTATCMERPISLNGFEGYSVNVGNPHFVVFQGIDKETFKTVAPTMEDLPNIYSKSQNIEFVNIITPSQVTVKVWERGSGATLACGTGATAVVAIGIKLGLLDNEVYVELPGGTVTVKYKEDIDNYYLCGRVCYVFEGIYYYKKVG